MNKGLVFGAGLGLGTGLMFLLDPDRGKRRRALLRDKCVWAARKTGEGVGVTARDLRNRTQGLMTEVQSRFSSGRIDDSVLIDRVRSKLGRVVSHPRAIHVSVQNGRAVLSGPILTAEVPKLLRVAGHVNGVNQVVNCLESHDEPGDHPELQGGRERGGQRFELFQKTWSPTTRFLAGAGIGAASLLVLKRRAASH
jgi:BON domain